MALNFPSSPTNGQTYTDDNAAVWRFDGVKWDVITSTTKKLFSGARVELGSDFSLTTTSTAISPGNDAIIVFDTDNYFSNQTPSRIYAPSNAFYRVNIVLTASSVGDGASYTVLLKRNGSFTYASESFGANQNIVFDQVLQLNAGDYVEVYASDSLGIGAIVAGSHIEINKLGLSVGTGISAYDSFSGAKTILTTPFSATSTPTAISWGSTEYDQNANVLGAEYWSELQASRVTIGVTGYYRIRTLIQTDSNGSEDSYTITLKKNNTTVLETINMGANDFILLNDIFQFSAADYIQIIIDNSGNTGAITTESFLEISRLGV
jgi:hypothetical protein